MHAETLSKHRLDANVSFLQINSYMNHTAKTLALKFIHKLYLVMWITLWFHRLKNVPGVGANPNVDNIFQCCIFRLLSVPCSTTDRIQMKSSIRGNRWIDRQIIKKMWRRSKMAVYSSIY